MNIRMSFAQWFYFKFLARLRFFDPEKDLVGLFVTKNKCHCENEKPWCITLGFVDSDDQIKKSIWNLEQTNEDIRRLGNWMLQAADHELWLLNQEDLLRNKSGSELPQTNH